MASSTLFEPHHNRLVDLNPLYPAPALPLTPSFVASYLAHRTPPPFRLTPHAPYATYDFVVHDALPHLVSCEQVLQHASLFPPAAPGSSAPAVTCTALRADRPGMKAVVERLVTRMSHAMKLPQQQQQQLKADTGDKHKEIDFELMARALHTLSSLCQCQTSENTSGGTMVELIVAALSPRGDKRAAIDRVRAWAREARTATGTATSLNGLSWRACTDAFCSALINDLLDISTVDGEDEDGDDVQGHKTRVQIGLKQDVESNDIHIREVRVQVPEVTTAIARLSLQEHGGDVSATVAQLRNGWRPSFNVGKKRGMNRTRRRASVRQLADFGDGDGVAKDWIKRRVVVSEATHDMEEEAEAEAEDQQQDGENVDEGERAEKGYNDWAMNPRGQPNKAGSSSSSSRQQQHGRGNMAAGIGVDLGMDLGVDDGNAALLLGAYDDDPDEGVLEGQVSLATGRRDGEERSSDGDDAPVPAGRGHALRAGRAPGGGDGLASGGQGQPQHRGRQRGGRGRDRGGRGRGRASPVGAEGSRQFDTDGGVGASAAGSQQHQRLGTPPPPHRGGGGGRARGRGRGKRGGRPQHRRGGHG